MSPCVANRWPARSSSSPQLAVVVDLAVLDDVRPCRPRSRSAGRRVSRSMIDSRRAASPTAAVDERAVAVRPAVDERRAHRVEPARVRATAGGRDSADPAHQPLKCREAPLRSAPAVRVRPPRRAPAAGIADRRRALLLLAPPLPDPVPDPAGRSAASRSAFIPGLPDLTLPPDARPRRRPAAAPVLRRLLHLAARSAANTRPITLLAVGLVAVTTVTSRSSAHCGIDGHLVEGGLRPRRGRLADRPDRRDSDRASARRAAAA